MSDGVEQLPRRDLWAVPLWEYDLTGEVDDPDDVVEAALGHLAATELPELPMHQSDNVLNHRVPALRQLLSAVEAVGRRAAADGLRVGPRQTLVLARAWVLRIDGSDDYLPHRGGVDLLHAHTGSALSAVCYLQLPPGGEGSDDTGTLFRAPHAATSRQLLPPTSVVVPSHRLHCLVFPGWLEHCPAPPRSPVVYERPRVVLAGDFRLIG